MSLAVPADPRLILSEGELDAGLELFLLADAAFWMAAEPVFAEGAARPPMGRGHFRAAFLMKRRPGLGVGDLARLTGLSKQGASRVLRDLLDAGYAEVEHGAEDGRRKPMVLTADGRAFEVKVAERMRAHLAQAYRDGGLDAVGGARRVLAAVAGPRATRRVR